MDFGVGLASAFRTVCNLSRDRFHGLAFAEGVGRVLNDAGVLGKSIENLDLGAEIPAELHGLQMDRVSVRDYGDQRTGGADDCVVGRD